MRHRTQAELNALAEHIRKGAGQRPSPHPYGCACDSCKAMTAAIIQKDASGEYFFTDDELRHMEPTE